eukprot:scaffold8452_cov185-Ochromonas_danica.AAC.14
MKLTLLFIWILTLLAECAGEKTLWFMTTQTDHSPYLTFIKAALNSVLLWHSGQLHPVLILSKGSQNVPLPYWLTKLTESGKVLILHHNLTFVDREVVQKYPVLNHPAYLRLDIPSLVPELAKTLPPSLRSTINFDYVLYTDCDVLFYPSFNINDLPKPKVISLGGEMTKDDIVNSGVLYMNVSAMNEHMTDFVEHGKNASFSFSVIFDQGYILSYFKDKLHVAELLPSAFNWKAYWGKSNSTAILHFHGPKPGRSAECFALMDSNGCDSPRVAKCVKHQVYLSLCKFGRDRYHVSADDMSTSFSKALKLFYHAISSDLSGKTYAHNE